MKKLFKRLFKYQYYTRKSGGMVRVTGLGHVRRALRRYPGRRIYEG